MQKLSNTVLVAERTYVWVTGEQTQINIMGNINEPYMASNRFEVAFTSTPPRFSLVITIVGTPRCLLTYLFIQLVVVKVRSIDGYLRFAYSSKLPENVNFERCRWLSY